MRNQREMAWVVYESAVGRTAERVRSVCGASEWSKIDGERPGFHTLIQAGLASEGEAERLARGKSGDTPPRAVKPRSVIPIIAGTPGEAPHSVRDKSGQFAPLAAPFSTA